MAKFVLVFNQLPRKKKSAFGDLSGRRLRHVLLNQPFTLRIEFTGECK